MATESTATKLSIEVVRFSSLSNQEYELNVFPRKAKLKQIPMSISGQVD
jgi:hypothetical protein